jgi:hypothetical protein
MGIVVYIFGILNVLLQAVVLQWNWNTFLVTGLGLPVLSFLTAIGILVSVYVAKGGVSLTELNTIMSEHDEDRSKKQLVRIFGSALAYLHVWLLGFVFSLFL